MAYLEIVKNQQNPDLNELWLKRLHTRTKENILQSLRPFGYYQAVVNSQLKKNSPGEWQARYQVNKGKRVKIVKVDAKISGGGANEPEILAALKKFPIKENDYLDHEVYETAKSNLLNLIGNLGFSDVKTEKKRLIIDPLKNSAELTLHINTERNII